MLSSFSGWHTMILLVPVLVLVGIGFAIYYIARAGARAGVRRELQGRPTNPADVPPSPRGD